MRTRLKFFAILILTFISFSNIKAQDDDFDFLDDDGAVDQPSETNQPAADSDTAQYTDSFDEFESDEQNAEIVDPKITHHDDFEDMDVDDEDGQVEDVEDDSIPVEKDDFTFGEDQIIDTGDSSEPAKRKFAEKQTNRNGNPAPKFSQVNVPSHLRENWNQYWIEGICLALIIYYIINYFQGKAVNDEIAKIWMNENLEFLKSQFYEVGGASASDQTPTISANSCNNYTLWCTGRKGCEGVLIELKLVARQDAITVWKNKFNKKRPEAIDFINVTFYFDDEVFTEPCILAVGQPRLISELWKNFNDLRTFCPKGPREKHDINPNFFGCAENVEMLTNIFDAKTKSTFANDDNNNSDPALKLGYLHVSDRYESMFVEEEGSKKLEMELAQKIFVTSLIVDSNQLNQLNSESFTKGIMYMADKIARMKLSKEAKSACEKRRRKAIEEEQKKQHQQRTEKAAEIAEAKRREYNRRIMDEEDPDKQSKLHNELMAKDARKRNKKFKMKTR